MVWAKYSLYVDLDPDGPFRVPVWNEGPKNIYSMVLGGPTRVDDACCVGYNITYKAVNICYSLIKFTPK